MSSRPLDIGAKLSHELTWNCGAALGTKYLTYREDSLLESASERYTMCHYESWVALARHKDYGNDVQPVLISGVDITRDFAMVAYSYEETSLESDMTFFFSSYLLCGGGMHLCCTLRTTSFELGIGGVGGFSNHCRSRGVSHPFC